jgi:predicted ATPase
VGKTRLALQVTADLRALFADDVAFVALAPLADPALVVATIAQALGLREVGGEPLRDTVQTALRDRRLLLVLDNFEHLAAAASEIVALLMACPRLVVLVTSRAALRVRGEQEYSVPPLALPDLCHVPTVEEATAAAAVALFVQRAQAANPEFVLTSANAAAVAAICRRLDGLPLALELAAARIKLLSPTALLARLDRALPLLVGGAQDLPERQQTMRTTIAWSYDLLSPPERLLLRRLPVFTGGCTLEAAEAVCQDDSLGDVHEGLSRLLDSSLVHREDVSPSSAGDGPRIGMLETIREYGLERLTGCGELAALRRRHAGYYLEVAEAAAPQLTGPDQAAWLARLAVEHDNLRAAMAWALEGGAIELGVRLCLALSRFWFHHGHVSEAQGWFDRALAASAPASRQAHARLLMEAGFFAWEAGDYARARALNEEGLALASALGLRAGTDTALTNLGLIALFEREYARAQDLLEEALGVQEESDQRAASAWTLYNLGLVATAQGDYPHATARLEESLAVAQESGGKWVASADLLALGLVAVHQGLCERAVGLARRGLQLAVEIDLKRIVPFALHVLTVAAAAQGQARRAGRLWGAAEALRSAMGNQLSPAEHDQYDRYADRARDQIGEQAWAVAVAEGRALSRGQAITEALADTGG